MTETMVWEGPSREFTYRNRSGNWRRVGFCWRPEWPSGVFVMYRGIVVRVGLRLGPLGFYALVLTDNETDPEVPS